MKTTFKKGIIALICILVGLSSFYTAHANSIDYKRNQLQEIQRNLKSAKEKLEKTKSEKKKLCKISQDLIKNWRM